MIEETPRRPWTMIALIVLAIPAVLCFAMVAMVGWRMREASSRVRAFCAEHPAGAAADVATIAARARSRGIRADVRSLEDGRARVEARDGVMTTVYLCAVEVRAGRVTASTFVRED